MMLSGVKSPIAVVCKNLSEEMFSGKKICCKVRLSEIYDDLSTHQACAHGLRVCFS
jgi:hypothetical protein